MPARRGAGLGQRKIEIEVRADLRRLLVTMPGSHYVMEFAQIANRLGLVSGFGPDDKKARVTSCQFAALAEKAAKDKASKLGWSTQRTRPRVLCR
jgi:hypothetical protein